MARGRYSVRAPAAGAARRPTTGRWRGDATDAASSSSAGPPGRPGPARGAGRRRCAPARRPLARPGAARAAPVSTRWARWSSIGLPQLGDARRRWWRWWRARAGASPTVAVRSSIRSRSRRVSSAPGSVGLVDHEHVGDLEQPGLVGLHGVAPAGVHHHDGGVGGAGHLHLHLADADGLDQHPRPAGGVERAHRLQGGEREAAEVAAGGHRADEHARRRWRGRPSAPGRRGSPRRRTATTGRWPAPPRGTSSARMCAEQRVGERRLAGARSPGDADRVGLAAGGMREAADARGPRARPARPPTAAAPAPPGRRRGAPRQQVSGVLGHARQTLPAGRATGRRGCRRGGSRRR